MEFAIVETTKFDENLSWILFKVGRKVTGVKLVKYLPNECRMPTSERVNFQGRS